MDRSICRRLRLAVRHVAEPAPEPRTLGVGENGSGGDGWIAGVALVRSGLRDVERRRYLVARSTSACAFAVHSRKLAGQGTTAVSGFSVADSGGEFRARGGVLRLDAVSYRRRDLPERRHLHADFAL